MQTSNEKLYEHVKRNNLGYFELAPAYRKVMDDFYENTYYQQDMVAAKSLDKTLTLHEAIADLGVGRDISIYLKYI